MAKKIAVRAKDAAPTVARPWTKHYDSGVPATLSYPDATMHALLDDAAESYPDAVATIFFNAKRTYKSISDDAWRFAKGLRKLGVKKGDRVAILLPNTPQFVIAFLGALLDEGCGAGVRELMMQLRRGIQGIARDDGSPGAEAARAETSVKNVIVTNIKEDMPPLL